MRIFATLKFMLKVFNWKKKRVKKIMRFTSSHASQFMWSAEVDSLQCI